MALELTCSICNVATFSSQWDVDEHQRLSCGWSSKATLTAHVAEADRTCELCGAIMPRVSDLERHRRKYHEELST